MSPMNPRKLVPTQEPGVLDFAPGAAAAYSLRSLSLSYTGPVVTVRRSTDNAEADFTASEVSDGTLAGWAGADGFVKTWWDQGGNARHATQATTGYQPQIVDSGVLVTEGGKAAVRFDGVDDWLSLASISSLQPMSFFTVTRRPTAATVAVVFFDALSNSAPYSPNNFLDEKLYVRNASGYGEASIGATTDFVQLSSVSADHTVASAQRLFVNGGEVSLSFTAVDGSQPINSIGKRLTSYGKGTASEMIVYQKDMIALQSRIAANQMWYY